MILEMSLSRVHPDYTVIWRELILLSKDNRSMVPSKIYGRSECA